MDIVPPKVEFRYLPRLSETAMQVGLPPWEFQPATQIPEAVRTDKKARDAWINSPKTNHYVYSGVEGVNPNLRVSKPKRDGGGNPPLYLNYLVADYDHPSTLDDVKAAASACNFPPAWAEKTLSGNWRLLWLFEKPMRVPSYSFVAHFLKKFEDFAFSVALLPGLDKNAFTAPERLWTNSCEWVSLDGKPIPAAITEGWLIRAASSFSFSKREFGPSIPLDKVLPRLREKYPRLANWPGQFTVGSHGPTFWIPESNSPKSATVQANGLFSFADHAAKSFYSWSELLGADFVKSYESERLSAASADLFYDGNSFWRCGEDGIWRSEERTNVYLQLAVERGLSKKVPKDESVSECDRALHTIITQNRVDEVLPAVFHPSGFFIERTSGKRILNTARIRVLEPADAKTVWGESGRFPFISRWLDTIFSPTALSVLLSWVYRGYSAAYRQSPVAGQIMFIAGPPGVGKTLLNTKVFGALFGGFADAANWLLSETTFNSELLSVGYWTVDDSSPASDSGRHKKWTFALKKMSANREFVFNEKYKKGGMTVWLGRICVTLNQDEDSIRLLPDLDATILDKLQLLQTEKVNFKFPENVEEIITQELPWFASWLLDYKIPEELVGDARFGIKATADPVLVESSRLNSVTAGFEELLGIWRKEYFYDNPSKDYWEGSATELFLSLVTDAARSAAIRSLTSERLGRHLSALVNKGLTWVTRQPNATGVRVWRVWKNNACETPAEVAA